MNIISWEKFKNESLLNLEDNHLFKIEVDTQFIEILNDYENILSEEELAKSKKYNRETDAKRFIASKYFLRRILSNFVAVEPKAIQFKQTSNKKPSVDGIEFNVTHSGNLILIVISKSLIGIDIELINKSFDFKPLLSNCFHPVEIDFLESNKNQIEDFYYLWTRKEALLKATGEGLTDELYQINCLDNRLIRNDLNFYLSSFFLEDNYITSLAKSKNNKTNFWEYW